jgi:hypothetical protein
MPTRQTYLLVSDSLGSGYKLPEQEKCRNCQRLAYATHNSAACPRYCKRIPPRYFEDSQSVFMSLPFYTQAVDVHLFSLPSCNVHRLINH